MNIIQLHNNPPVYLIKQVYNEEERFNILNELLFLQPKLADVSTTDPATDDGGECLARKTGVFLDEVYNVRGVSDILKANRSTYDIFTKINHWFFDYQGEYRDYTLVSYYEEADHYKPHRDKSLLTGISWFYQKPKNFSGGDLEIPSLNITIPCEDNSMVIFPGCLLDHSVTEINIINKNREKSGRFAISQFFVHGGY